MFQLPELPFAKDAFKGVFTAETFEYHHGKHHAAYVNNLNNLIKGSDFEAMDLNSIIMKSEGGVFNNASQHFNHSFFWNCMSPNGGGAPKGDLASAIDKSFGSFDEFKEKFSAAAATLFGSGWAWLAKNADGSLEIIQTPNAGSPLKLDKTPLLTIDVWEHAYYIDYRNARPDFIKKFWEVANWDFAAKQF
jgi:Fe-Mn family superoxide dismutase